MLPAEVTDFTPLMQGHRLPRLVLIRRILNHVLMGKHDSASIADGTGGEGVLTLLAG